MTSGHAPLIAEGYSHACTLLLHVHSQPLCTPNMAFRDQVDTSNDRINTKVSTMVEKG